MTDRTEKILVDFTKIDLPFAEFTEKTGNYSKITLKIGQLPWTCPEDHGIEQHLPVYVTAVGILLQNYYDSDDAMLACKTSDCSKELFVRIRFTIQERVFDVSERIRAALAKAPADLTDEEIRILKDNTDVLISTVPVRKVDLACGYCIVIDLSQIETGSISVFYQKSVIHADNIRSFGDNLITVIKSAFQNENDLICNVQYVSDHELEMIRSFNETADDLGTYRNLHELFHLQAQKFADKKAVVFEDQFLTYGELDEKSDDLASILAGMIGDHVQSIGIYSYRCTEMIVSMLGVLKAGCAYVPIDPDYPEERIGFMIKEAGVSYVITTGDAGLSVSEGVRELKYDDLMKTELKAKVHQTEPEDLAYIIFTSGSTGTPKGVLIEHRNVLNTLLWRRKYYDFTEHDVVLQMPSFSFDSSVEDIFTALISGSELVLTDHEMRFHVGYLERQILTHHVTHAMFLPSFYAILLQVMGKKLSGLRHITLAGEAVSQTLVETHFSILPDVEAICECGPTETCVCANVYKYNKTDIHIYLGHPIANAKCHVINRNGMLSPIGGIGESWVESPGVGRGYLNNPRLTQQKFIDKQAHALNRNYKMYKSGDMVKWTIDGNIEFVGRRDNQIKVRGFRVEPGGVEQKIIDTRLVENVVVSLNQTENVLEAFVVMRSGFTVQELKNILATKLPRYMLPTYYREVRDIPKLPNGKIDRNRIQLIEKKECIQHSGMPAAESDLLKVLSDIVGQPIDSVDDLLEDCGLSSLGAIYLIYELEKRYKIKIVLAQLMKCSVRELMDIVANRQNDQKIQRIEEVLPALENEFRMQFRIGKKPDNAKCYALFFQGGYEEKEEILRFIDLHFQDDLLPEKVICLDKQTDSFSDPWHAEDTISQDTLNCLLEDLRIEIQQFHDDIVQKPAISDCYSLSGIQMGHIMMPDRYVGDVIVTAHTMQESRIEEVLKKLIKCNSMLRSVPVYENGEWLWNEYSYQESLRIPRIDISNYSVETQCGILKQVFRRFYYVDFNAAYKKQTIMPYQFILAKRSQKDYILLAFMDHLVYDAISYDILKKALETLDCSRIHPLRFTYKDYITQTSCADGKVSEEDLSEVLQIEEYSKAVSAFFSKVKASQGKEILHIVAEGISSEKNSIFKDAVCCLTDFLSSLYQVDNLPFSFLQYGRQYNGKSYYEVFGEFVDFIPVTVRRSDAEADLEKLSYYTKYFAEHELNLSSVLFCRTLRKKYRKFIRSYLPESEVFTPNLLKFNFVGFRDEHEHQLLDQILDHSDTINAAQRQNGVVCEVFCIDETRFELNLYICYDNQQKLINVLNETGKRSDVKIREVKHAGIIDVESGRD